MGDEIAHVGIVHCPLRIGFPGGEGGLVVGKNPDDMDLRHIAEDIALRIDKLTAEDKMQSLCQFCPLLICAATLAA